MTSGGYAAAGNHAKSKVAEWGKDAGILREAERLAKVMAGEPAARIRGAKTLVGRKKRLKLAARSVTATVKAVTDSGLAIVTTYTINNRTRERRSTLKWRELHADQKAEFAKLGGIEMGPADSSIAATYAALASDDLDAAGKAAEAAGDHPLGKHLAAVVRARVKQLAYESAMERARELVEKKELKDAALECKKALEARPGDERAEALLAEVQRLIAPPELTLDLGDGVAMEFIYIEPGTFVMGGESTSEGRFHCVEVPKHSVTITKGFYLGKYEVTQEQFEVVMGKNPSRSTRDPNCPVDNVSWHDANGFCKKVAEKTGRKVRLPTEAEWEYACRAGTDTPWSHGDDPAKLTEYAWTSGNSDGRSHPVGQKKPNPWGLHDIHGNVCERVADMYHRDYYAN
ncbi:MAG: formylglycine-generating enzyme family protein, partial [Planctomycetota bacterium]